MVAVEFPIQTVCTPRNNGDIVSKIEKSDPFVVNSSPNQSIRQHEAVLVLRDDAVPIFHAPYSVPFKLRDRVKSELNKSKMAH